MNKDDISVKMSNRLITVANMLRGDEKETLKVADVGCDHGYVSIYLVQNGIAASAIAMDVRKGPLSGAAANIHEYGLDDKITTRLSDGLKELKSGEANCLVIAGMGGKLMERLVEEGEIRRLGIKTAILQPQSDIDEFRQFIRDKGYIITDEKVIFEDGKYYFPMRIEILSDQDAEQFTESASFKSLENLIIDSGEISKEQLLRICNRYGECNLLKKEPLLIPYLEHGEEVLKSILKNLDDSHNERREIIMEELSDISFARKIIS